MLFSGFFVSFIAMKQRIIKLTGATYKLLEFFPESDPLKNKAKERVLLIMESFFLILESGEWLSFKDYFSESREKVKIKILQDIDILLGYFEVARQQDWINRINCLIICNEYEKIKEKIDLKPMLYAGSEIKSGVRETNNQKLNNRAVSESQNQSSLENQSQVSHVITARQKKIIEFLSKHEKAQVMDLKTVLLNVTKRTIRRDLDELLRLGKIQRMGEFNRVFYRLKR